MARHDRHDTHDRKGVSLAKGPAGITGLILLAFGVLALIFGSTDFDTSPIDGDVFGESFLGFELNGWSAVLTIAAGALLVFGAPLHWGAKSMSLIVGLALGAASVISLYDGQDVFGIFAADGETSLGWGAAAAVLLVVALLPRVGKGRHADDRRDLEHRDERVVDADHPDRRRGERFDRDAERDPAERGRSRDTIR